MDKIHKNRLRKNSPAQQLKEKEFKDELDNVFDIAHHTVMENLEEDRWQFLESQRNKNHRGLIDINALEKQRQNLDDDDQNTEPEQNTGKVSVYVFTFFYFVPAITVSFLLKFNDIFFCVGLSKPDST